MIKFLGCGLNSLFGWCAIATLPAISLLIPRLSAQEPAATEEVPPTKLVLTPKAAPEPALKYLLLPAFIDQQPGNAAVHYGKIKSEQTWYFSSQEVAMVTQHAQDLPLAELKSDRAYDQLVNLGPIYSNMQRGARSATVDWQLPLREAFFTELLLPEVQESRHFIRILHGRARVQMARGDYEGAVATIQTGMAMARHLAEGPTLINGLVGNASMDTMLGAVQELITQPDAPNLYWALANLPTPLVATEPGLEAERYMLYYTEEGWLHPEKLQGDEHFWRGELNRLWSYMTEKRSDPAALAADSMLGLLVVRGYPEAKQRLIDRKFPPEQVEAMPVPKVMMLDALHQYNCNVDASVTKIRQALIEPSRLAELRKEQAQRFPEALPLSNSFAVATLHSVAHAILRVQRRHAALQVVEALRMHAAESGKFPDRLQDLTSVRLPLDPSSGQPFTYERSDESAVLTSSALMPQLKLELSMSPKRN